MTADRTDRWFGMNTPFLLSRRLPGDHPAYSHFQTSATFDWYYDRDVFDNCGSLALGSLSICPYMSSESE